VIGVAAAMGVALATIEYKKLPKKEFLKKVKEAAGSNKKHETNRFELVLGNRKNHKNRRFCPDDPPEISDLVVEEVQIMAKKMLIEIKA